VTADGVVVLFHDSDLRRVAGPRQIAHVRHAELAEIMSDAAGS
jgi:glycerophosphoryl diester phosphodiesterase